MKKRHGLLIEKALINAINKLPKWSAMKECVQTSNGQAHVDCLAHNSDTQQLYVFECKRGHGQFDGDRVRAIDSRLGRVATAIGPHAARKGWAVKSTDVFILSFYGRKWKSKYPIYDMTEIAKVFPPCLRTFAQEFARHSEFEVSQSYGREFSGVDISASDPRTVFDDIDEEQHPGEFVVFEEQSARIYRRPTAP